MVASSTAPDINGRVINIGSGVETSLRALLKSIRFLTENKFEVLYNPRKNPGVSRMCADLTLAEKYLGFSPKISLEDGLRLTVERDPRFQPQPKEA
jgi:nucleoside-diphosphate-sugar epimerase